MQAQLTKELLILYYLKDEDEKSLAARKDKTSRWKGVIASK